MSLLFTPQTFGTLTVPNRIVRSATAERMADDQGRLTKKIFPLYRRLAEGGAGLIISGHMYVHPDGKAHPEMTGIYADDLLPGLAKLADTIHQAGGLAAAQINHGGIKNDAESFPEAAGPSALTTEEPFVSRDSRALTPEEIETLIDAYAQAARRAKQAGFDAVQIHAAHGYLISQFLSPAANRRSDEWGGSFENRLRFLHEVVKAVRAQVGPDFPLFTKLGMMDGVENGLTLEDGARIVGALDKMGLDAVELSGGIGGEMLTNVKKGIRNEEREAYFIEFARKAKAVSRLPVMLVGGFRSRAVMEQVLAAGEADFISMCRPLINDPAFPNKLKSGETDKSGCISANNCWAREMGEGIACKCPIKA
ncbi:MAG: NADH:flavin oxidoreductase [Anaerolineales bacterium]|nr:NADH:flavin oxidoreductase [Anaerolineales bacterium]